jgi:small subunit ribosomal protein S20
LPGKGSAAKRNRQSEKNRTRNRIVKSRVRTSTRKFIDSVSSNAKEEAQAQFKEISSLLDRAVSKGVLHRNTAARKKQRLNKRMSSLS